MQTITEIAIQKATRGIFTRQEAACWVNNEGARLDALLKRSTSAGEILHIRRGLFCLANNYTHTPIHAFELAQRIYGPSYLSLESALAHHGWIPEAVYTITSVSQARSRNFETSMGVFSYTRIPQDRLFECVHRQQLENGGSFFVAEPLKALADYVYAHSCDWYGVGPVMDSLRVDEEELATLTTESFERLKGVYRSNRVREFLNALRKDMKL